MEEDHQKDSDSPHPTDAVRGGVTGHNVRYVLAFSLLGVVVAFILILAWMA